MKTKTKLRLISLAMFVVAVVFVICALLLQVYDGDHIAVFVIGIAGTELLLVQLNAIKPNGIGIVVIPNGDGDGGISLFGNDNIGSILPGVAAGIKLGRGFLMFRIIIMQFYSNVKGAFFFGYRHGAVCPCPAGEHIAIPFFTAYGNGLLQFLDAGGVALDGIHIAVQRGGCPLGGGDEPVSGSQTAARPVIGRAAAVDKITVVNEVIAAGSSTQFHLSLIHIQDGGRTILTSAF